MDPEMAHLWLMDDAQVWQSESTLLNMIITDNRNIRTFYYAKRLNARNLVGN